jgi:GNAT superfamily N-acetyltransferase
MTQNRIRDLGDGLILRRSTVADTEALVAFHADVQREPGEKEPEEYVGAWVRDLMERPHPTFNPGDFTIVEDTETGKIVSSLCLISQTWSYGGIDFGMGRPELVGTHPDYRRRGLIRAQFEVIHGWSAERGEMVQGITGVPWYYRQFGYEMAATLGGGRACYKPQVPRLKKGEQEAYRLRPATEDDLAFIAGVYEQGTRRYPLACVRDEAMWQYDLKGKSEKNVERPVLCVVESTDGRAVGMLAHSPRLWKNRLRASVYELEPGISWLAVTPSVVRHLWAQGESWAEQVPGQAMERLTFGLGVEHPVYQVFHDRLPHTIEPYAWYLRVPDLAGFFRHIAPVLARRLAGSFLPGHNGRLKLSFYRNGLCLVFEEGELVAVEAWQPTTEDGGDAAFPDLTFLQLLFGYRSLKELKHTFADCRTANDEARALLEALFPKQPSDVWPVS